MKLLPYALLALAVLLAATIALNTNDSGMLVHALIFAAAAALGAYALFSRKPQMAAAGPGDEDRWEYNDGVVRVAVVAAMFWGLAGFLVGLVLSLQLAFPALNFDISWFNFGRLRPVHTSAVIFAFGGNVLIATSFYVVQRTCRTRLAGDLAPWFVVGGYQLFIVLAATGYLFGITQSKEYAEPEWYIDLWLTVVWVVYLLVFLATLWRRREPHIYVANWFYLAFIVTVAMLHLVNNLSLPVSLFGAKSYSAFAGVQDALTQWWYAHNAVGFFLTAGFLGIVYYFVPKQVGRPIYSYRLSVIHFWALIFLYIWAGPHHLLFTALPFDHPLDAVLGRHDQRPHDPVGVVGQNPHRPDHPLHGRGVGVLWHEHLRGSADGDQDGECAQPLHRLDNRPRAFRRAGVGRLYRVRRDLLSYAAPVEAQPAVFAASG
jgi:cytochrome c oxidase cbb3-type subunit 1